MNSGLYIICTPGGYYPYVRIGWCQRDDIMIRLESCRVIKRFGTEAELNQIAEEGPKSTTQLLKIAKRAEGASVSMISRWIECNPEAWKDHVPKPKGWATS